MVGLGSVRVFIAMGTVASSVTTCLTVARCSPITTVARGASLSSGDKGHHKSNRDLAKHLRIRLCIDIDCASYLEPDREALGAIVFLKMLLAEKPYMQMLVLLVVMAE